MKKLYFFAVMVLILNTISAQVPPNLDSALISCYPFSGNAIDATGGNHGTVNGAVLISDRFGNANAAYSFNGSNQNILIPAFNTQITSNEFSLSFWAKATGYATRSPFLLVPDDAANRLNVHIYYGNALSNSQTFFDWGSIYASGRLYIAGSPIPAAGAWDHWVFTNSAISGTMKCYKNGVLMLSKTGNGFLNTTLTRNLLFGGGVGTGSSHLWFAGALDDIKIYGRELNQADVNALFIETIRCVEIITDIKGNPELLGYSIYPNPTNSTFNIKGLGTDKSYITVTSISGAVVRSVINNSNEIEINVSDLETGVYILTIQNTKGVYNQKIVKE